MPLPLLDFPKLCFKGPQNMGLFNVTTFNQYLSYRCRSGAQGEGGSRGGREWEPQSSTLGLNHPHYCWYPVGKLQ